MVLSQLYAVESDKNRSLVASKFGCFSGLTAVVPVESDQNRRPFNVRLFFITLICNIV